MVHFLRREAIQSEISCVIAAVLGDVESRLAVQGDAKTTELWEAVLSVADGSRNYIYAPRRWLPDA
jgi:hypothetical protein